MEREVEREREREKERERERETERERDRERERKEGGKQIDSDFLDVCNQKPQTINKQTKKS